MADATRRLDPAAALLQVRRALERPSAVVLIDGRSGAGKTSFGAACGAPVLHLEDVYPGWDGLEAASTALQRALALRRRGVPAVLPSWDWVAGRPGPPLVVPAAGPLVVEGCGALSRASRASADLGVWLELPADERRRRALARDGDAFAPHWERWARQERRSLAREDPPRLADLVVDGSRSPRSAGAQ